MNKKKLLLILFLGCLALAQYAIAQSKSSPSALSDFSEQIHALSNKVSPAVVNIIATGWSSPTDNGGNTLLSKNQSTGSGVILDVNGYIVTNAHVVEDAHLIEVIFNRPADKSQFKSILKPKGERIEAKLVGMDDETDLAVLKIDLTGLSYLELANSDDIKQGQLVFAFGSPLGLQNSMSMGVVSSVARQLKPEAPMIYIQTDAAINPGNSGGPLVNADGKVVGINTLMFTQSGGNEGLGFAAPSNIVANVYKQIKEFGRVRRGEIGVFAQTISPGLASGLKLSNDWGVVLGDVFPESPADKAGLKIGDIVLSLNGKPMENGRQFNVNLYSKNVGDTVTLEILRKDKTMIIKTSVIERKDDYERFADLVSPDQNLVEELGILGLELNKSIIDMLPRLRTETGVLVADRITPSTFTEDHFRPGDIIHAINGTTVAGLAVLKRTLKQFAHDESIVAQIERRGKFMYLVVQIQ